MLIGMTILRIIIMVGTLICLSMARQSAKEKDICHVVIYCTIALGCWMSVTM